MHYVYVLFCADRRLYIGYSANLQDRIATHKAGRARPTKHRLPVVLMYYEGYANKADAQAREIFLKSGAGHAQMKRQHQHELRRLGYLHL